MACTTCGSLTTTQNYTTCNPCTTIDPTSTCPIQLSSKCVFYLGEEALTNIPAAIGDNLEDILIALDTYISTATSGLFLNVGAGAQSYKQVNTLGQAEFRTLVSADSSIVITQNTDEIDLVVDAGSVGENNTASNVGGGAEVFKVKTGVDLGFRTILPFGGITITQQADTLTIDGSSVVGTAYTASTLGGGAEVFSQLSANDFEFRSILPLGGIVITQQADTLTIDGSAAGNTYTGSNVGGGAGVFSQILANDIEHKSLVGVSGVDVTELATTITVGLTPLVEQIEEGSNVTLDDTMNNQVVFLNNLTNNVLITIPAGLMDDFKCGFIRLGSGSASFQVNGTTINTAVGVNIAKQYDQAFVQKRNAGTEEYILLGNLS